MQMYRTIIWVDGKFMRQWDHAHYDEDTVEMIGVIVASYNPVKPVTVVVRNLDSDETIYENDTHFLPKEKKANG